MNILNQLRKAEQHMQAGRLHQAHAVCGKVLKNAPHDLSAHIVLGTVLLRKKDYAASERALKQVIAAIPGHVDANNNLGVICLEYHNDFEAAKRYFTAALAADPGNLNALGNLGNTWMKLGKLDAAEACYRKGLDLDPKNLIALNNLGVLLFKQRRFEEAARHLWKTLELCPEDVEVYFNLASTLMICGNIPQAVELMRRIMKLADPSVALLTAFVIAKMTCCWEISEGVLARVVRLILGKAATAEGLAIVSLSLLADHRIDNDALFAVHLAMGESIDAMRSSAPFETYPNVAQKKAKLRLGYLSADFRQHVASNYIRSLVNHYDSSRFEVYCYSNTQREDDLTGKYRAGVDAFVNVCDLTDAELARKIHDDRIDILVDLGGYTQDSRIHVLSYRAAPVQITYLGYPYSSGLQSVDYMISDTYLDGPLNARYCTGTPLRLPQSSGVFGALGEQNIDPVPAYERNGHVTFGSLINTYKLHPDIIQVWSAILRRISSAVLVLNHPHYQWEMIRSNITQEFARHGITENQLKFVWERHAQGGHLRYYNDIDIALDPFPMSGGQTSVDAVWMGVPLVTLVGDTHHHRLSYSLLRNVGIALDDLIAFSREEYVEKALALAQHPARIKELRQAIPQALKGSILCDPVRFARQMEAVYIEGWNKKFPNHPFRARDETAAEPVEFMPLRTGAEVAVSGLPGDLADFVIREQAGWFDPEYDFVHRMAQPGMRVVDINPGRGLYALPLARKIAPAGELWAIPCAGDETELLLKAVQHNQIGNLHLADGAESLAHVSHEMGGVDFIRLNMSGDDALQLIKNEQPFFSDHSPLVMFSARRADTLDLALADGFSGLGYVVYRYVPGLDMLVPLATPEDLDPFALNLFACKPDRAQLLAQQGLLVNALPVLAGLPSVHEKIWQRYLGALPYAAGFMAQWTDPTVAAEGWESYHVALNLFSKAQSSETAAGERYACLHAAHGILAMLVSTQPTLPRLLSLARVLTDIGQREQAVQVLNSLLALFDAGEAMASALEMDEPFLALSDQAASINPGARMAEWIFASVLEQRETLRAFSAFFLGPDHIEALQAIERTGFMGAAMARRLHLIEAHWQPLASG